MSVCAGIGGIFFYLYVQVCVCECMLRQVRVVVSLSAVIADTSQGSALRGGKGTMHGTHV